MGKPVIKESGTPPPATEIENGTQSGSGSSQETESSETESSEGE